MVGQVLGAVGALPDIYTELEISYFLLRRLLGVRTEGDKKGAKVRLSIQQCCAICDVHVRIYIAIILCVCACVSVCCLCECVCVLV